MVRGTVWGWLLGVGIVALATILGCGGAETGGGPAPGAPTYYEDVKPILDAKCTACHSGDGIAPFSLVDIEEARPWASLIKKAVTDRTMPPWLADPGCNQYLDDRTLSDAQIDTIVSWVDGGMPLGDPSKAAPPLQKGPSRALSRVDRTLPIPAEYTPQIEPDDYRCFVIDWPETEVSFITGFGAKPGEPRIVHHVVAFLAEPAQVPEIEARDAADPGPGYACYGNAGTNKARWVGAWVPGATGDDRPAGTGLRVEPGSKLIVQIHYNTLSAGKLPDRTAIELKLESSVEKEARLQPYTNPGWPQGTIEMKIPALAEDSVHSFSADPTPVLTAGEPMLIYGATMHMHTLGTRGSLRIDRADGGTTCLLDIPRWNFHWQDGYDLVEPVVFQPGDKLTIECHYANTPPMQPIIDGKPKVPADVYWGESTSDEMCLGAFYMTKL